MIREYFEHQFCFYHTGIANVDMKSQLSNFHRSLINHSVEVVEKPQNWFDAFEALKKIILLSKRKKKIVFIDELPWMDTPRSNFLPALEHFWNSWGSARKDLIFIICGSATSYIVKNILYLFNFNNASEYCFTTWENNSFNHQPQLYGANGGNVHTVAQACDGIQFFGDTGNIQTGSKFVLYGLKK